MSRPPICLALVGLGKIARDQHVPAIGRDPGFALAATADPVAGLAGIPAFPTLEALLDRGPPFDAIAICTPPQVRHGLARRALSQAKHVLLEKPPAASLGEVDDLRAVAQANGRTIFAAWHSRFAPAVAPARAWLAARNGPWTERRRPRAIRGSTPRSTGASPTSSKAGRAISTARHCSSSPTPSCVAIARSCRRSSGSDGAKSTCGTLAGASCAHRSNGQPRPISPR
jgi:predicted dehydrogenase